MLIELSAKIGAKTIAEGIETAEEYECCRELGIDLIQGYYLVHAGNDRDRPGGSGAERPDHAGRGQVRKCRDAQCASDTPRPSAPDSTRYRTRTARPYGA
jgi:EAL domain-containing protein (putative c-di-GMP-specific phosphodiesterase class I)